MTDHALGQSGTDPSFPLGQTTGYQYDLLGNRIALLDPDKGAFAYSYDAANRLTALTDPEGRVTSHSYDELGRVVSTDLPNKTVTVNAYDANNRLAAMVTTSDKDGVLVSFQYAVSPLLPPITAALPIGISTTPSASSPGR